VSEIDIPMPDVSSPAAETAGVVVHPRLLLVLQAAVFMVSAEARVIAPLLPAIALGLGSSVAAAGMLITAYTIPYGLFQLVYGPLADRFSRQRVMGVALGLFSLGTFLSGFGPNMPALYLLRFATGAAAAGVIPIALAYVGDAVPYQQRQAALGRVVSVAALGGVLSAALGGVIATLLSWRALFIGYGLLALLVSAVLLRLPVVRLRAPQPRAAGLLGPYRAIFRLAGSRATALYSLVFFEGMIATLVSWRMLFIGYGLLALAVSAVLLRLPVVRLRAPQPRAAGLLGPYRAIFRLAGSRATALYCLVFCEGMVATSTSGYFGALLFERDHLPYATIGALLTLNGVASIIAARFVGRLVARVGERGMLLIGGALMSLAYLLVALQPFWLFFPLGMLVAGAGFVIAHSTLQTRATELVPDLRGTAVALFAFSLFLGGGLGTSLAGLTIDHFGYVAALAGTAALLALWTALSGPALRAGRR
jgi:predicted MFS family arabinose efflux permease